MVGIKGDLAQLEQWAASHSLGDHSNYTPMAEKKKHKTILSQLAQQLITDTKGLIKIVQNEPLRSITLQKTPSFMPSG